MPSPVIIGRILATEKAPTTIDNFAFCTNPSLILNPFDIVKVEHVNGSFSYGMIEDISHITDAASFLTNYISSDFGDVEVESPTLRVGMNYVQAKVVCNDKNIYIPLQSNSKVFLATAEEIDNDDIVKVTNIVAKNGTVVAKGLDNGEYAIVEEKAPSGYSVVPV